tara:strand:- start:5061 stop:5570 length:510 start_codon:yes stop_codon:yes gene_type:complete
MKKLLLLLLFIPLISFGQEDIERFKVYDTDNIYTSILLDTATGQTWQLQIGIGDSSTRMKTVLSDTPYAEFLEDITKDWTENIESKTKDWEENYNSKPDSIVSAEDKEYWKPYTLKQKIEISDIAQNGRFKLYPTENTYNFIMVDVIDGRTWQVQWNIDYDKRLCYRIY